MLSAEALLTAGQSCENYSCSTVIYSIYKVIAFVLKSFTVDNFRVLDAATS
jgi:hypothetical protein